MTELEERQLIEDVKSLTDHMVMVDEVFKAMRVGQNMVLAFQCGHSGLYLPSDYVKNWGRGYGLGLGPNPVSEVLDTDYFTKPPAITEDTESFDQIMHPVGATFAQVDYMLVEESQYLANQAILARDDSSLRKRVAIIREKQLVNPKSKLRMMALAWAESGKAVV